MSASAGRWSLRTRLMVLAGIATIVAWLTGGIATLIAAHVESERLYDERLRDVAHVILSFASHEIAEIRAESPDNIVHRDAAATLDRRYRYQVWARTGELLLTSDETSRTRFAPAATNGYLDADLAGRPHCIYVTWSADGEMQIQVAEDSTLRDSFFVNLNTWLVLVFVGSTVLLFLLNGWMFGRATRALDQSAQQLLQRSADDLRPIAADDPPRELAPLLASINTLFGRFEHTLDTERHFTAAAAHELRTPLAAVKVQAQVAARARSATEMRRALRDLGVCVDRAARMIDQLLTLARIESTADNSAMAPVRIDSLAAAVMRDLAPLLSERRLDIGLDLQPCAVHGMEFGVAALMRNLIDNAVRYSPAGGRVHVATGIVDGEAFASVEDSGPGIPAAERERVFVRFYRIAGNAIDGCGVGLSIVRCVAEAHGARVTLSDSRFGGLRATVHFPRRASA